MVRGVVLALAVIIASVVCVGVASANEVPLPSAGLDQEVREGTTVYLDAGGSTDPDGSIESYRWTITVPNGTTTSPDCPTCVQTQFFAGQNGTYNVTVTVTDDDGATRSDTMYVTVEGAAPPTVTLAGPSEVEVGETATFEAHVEAGAHELEQLVWKKDGQSVSRRDVADGDTVSSELSFEKTTTHNVSVTVMDTIGNVDETTHWVDVGQALPMNASGGPSGGPGGPQDVYRDMDGGAYQLHVENGQVMGPGNQPILDVDDVNKLENAKGVKYTYNSRWVGDDKTLKITNDEIKQDIDYETGNYGAGFDENGLTRLNPGEYDDSNSDTVVDDTATNDGTTNDMTTDDGTISDSMNNDGTTSDDTFTGDPFTNDPLGTDGVFTGIY